MVDRFPEMRKSVRRSPKGDPTEFFQNFQYEEPTYDEVARADHMLEDGREAGG